MIYRLFLFIFGSLRFRVSQFTANTLNMLIRENINTYGMHKEGDILVFDIPLFGYRRLKGLFSKYSLPFPMPEPCGIPSYLPRYKKRWGLFVGVLALFAIVYLSSVFVWRINIIGNETIRDGDIISDLNEMGFGVGSFIPSVNVKLLCNKYLLQNDKLSWVGINIVGNCVDVRVRETLGKKDETPPDGTPSVIIAASDGFIERIVLKNGEIIQNVGSAVRKGDTIISGVVESPDGTFRLVRSEAEVYAKTTHSFCIDIPLETVFTVEKEYPQSSKSLLFFSKLFALPSKAPQGDNLISRVGTEYLTLFGNITLPVGLVTKTYYSLENRSQKITEKEAAKLARAELAAKTAAEFAGADILAISLNETTDDSTYHLEVTVYCIENIALEQKIVGKDFKWEEQAK